MNSFQICSQRNKIKETDALGNITIFEYDTLNNLIKTTFADSKTKSATYTNTGLVVSKPVQIIKNALASSQSKRRNKSSI